MTGKEHADSVALRRGGAIPILGFGTWQIRGRLAREALNCALQTGYRHIDTATMYANEREVGRALADSGILREELFITTKLLPDSSDVRRAIETSLSDLQLDFVDLWLIHWPPRRRARSLSLFEEMLSIRDEGVARAIGVSNYSIDEIEELTVATGDIPEVNQIPWSPFLYDPAEEHELARRHIVLEGYSPLKKSQLDHPVLVDIAAAVGRTPAQVVLRWHVQHGVVVIPKSADPARIAENFDIFNFSLDTASMEQLDEIASP